MIKFKYLKNALVLTMLVLSPFTVKAQEISQNTSTDTDTENSTGVNSDSDVYDNEISKKLDTLMGTVEKQQEQLVSQQKQYDEFKQEMETRLDEAQNERDDFQTQLLSIDEGEDKKLSIYGFMDFSFIKTFTSNKDSVIYTSVPYHSRFTVGNVNLFVQSNPAPTIEALIETRLTFQPNGQVYAENLPVVVYKDGKESLSYGEFERVSTDVSDGKGGTIRLGGVMIERAQFDWKPLDLFNIRVGHYLTPYGIYNEDHGSPVQIDASVPFIITNNYLPNAQTGIMLFGSAYPADVLGIEYAVTLSNGRGPVSELYDLDKNKAVGARLKLKFQFGDFKITAGGYGYYGKYTDDEYTLKIYLDSSEKGFDPKVDQPIIASSDVTSKYKEKIITADLKLEFKGLQLLGEYVGRRVEYITPPLMESGDTLNLGAGLSIPAVQSNYAAQGAYAMLAYTLPLHKFLKQTQITPYFGLDYHSPHDMYKINNSRMMRFGLNIKPSPYVTLKSAASAIKFKDETFFGGPVWTWTNQVAVSF